MGQEHSSNERRGGHHSTFLFGGGEGHSSPRNTHHHPNLNSSSMTGSSSSLHRTSSAQRPLRRGVPPPIVDYAHESKHDTPDKVANMLFHQHLQQSTRKGLGNDVGENNCFLNAVLQSLWHLHSFRQIVIANDHRHVKPTPTFQCILCSLQALFVQYEYSEKKVLPANDMRSTLGTLSSFECSSVTTSQTDVRFQLGEMSDATEAFDAILQYLYDFQAQEAQEQHTAEELTTDCYNPPLCISQTIFNIIVSDIHICQSCGSASKPETWNDNLYRLYVTEVAQILTNISGPKSTISDSGAAVLSISTIIQQLSTLGPTRSCPRMEETQCKGFTRTERRLQSFPLVFGLNLVWESTEASTDQLHAIYQLIISQENQDLDLQAMGSKSPKEKKEKYRFRGFVCYYGKHYVSFFISNRTRQWYLFDDTNVKCIGPMNQLAEKLRCGNYQPTMLFWEQGEEQIKTTLMGIAVDDEKKVAPPIESDDEKMNSAATNTDEEKENTECDKDQKEEACDDQDPQTNTIIEPSPTVRIVDLQQEPPAPINLDHPPSSLLPAQIQSWTCPMCTLENEIHQNKCEVCGFRCGELHY